MTKLNMEETPSVQAVAKAAQSVEVIDSAGRIIKLKKPGVLAQYRLIEALGDSAKNDVYVNMVLPLIYVTEIDGEAANMPINKIQVEALIQRLDEHGVQAVMAGVLENFGKTDPEADKTALKK